MLKLSLDQIQGFRESVEWLKDSYQAILDCFDDPDFRRSLVIHISRLDVIANKMGTIEVTIQDQ